MLPDNNLWLHLTRFNFLKKSFSICFWPYIWMPRKSGASFSLNCIFVKWQCVRIRKYVERNQFHSNWWCFGHKTIVKLAKRGSKENLLTFTFPPKREVILQYVAKLFCLDFPHLLLGNYLACLFPMQAFHIICLKVIAMPNNLRVVNSTITPSMTHWGLFFYSFQKGFLF